MTTVTNTTAMRINDSTVYSLLLLCWKVEMLTGGCVLAGATQPSRLRFLGA
jgi:hypothetical protein